MRRRYALLDRDGTIIVERNYLKSIADLKLLPHSAEGLRKLSAQGFGLIIITNQSGIGRGLMTAQDVEAVHTELHRRLSNEGVQIDGIYYCPHAPDVNCGCRKPKTALALQAAKEHGFDPRESIVIGDKASDIEFGRALEAARTILVRTGYGKQHEHSAHPDQVADDLLTCTVP